MAQVEVREYTSTDGDTHVRWAGPFDVRQGDRQPKHVIAVTTGINDGTPSRRAYHYQHPINAQDAWDYWTGAAER